MSKKKKNIVISISNIAFIIFYMIRGILDNALTEDRFADMVLDNYVTNTAMLQVILGFASIIILLIFNIVASVRNRKNKKIMIMNLLSSILLILTFVIGFIAEEDIVIILKRVFCGLIVLVNIIQIIFIIKENNYDESNNNGKVSLILHIVFILILIAFALVGSIDLILKNNYVNNNKIYVDNLIAQISNSSVHNDEYILLKKNNKYGCIGQDGKVKIDFKYDEFQPIWTYIEINGKKCYFTYARRNNDYKIITKDNREIDLDEEKIISPQAKNKMVAFFLNISSAIMKRGTEYYTEEREKNTVDVIDTSNNYGKSIYDSTSSYRYSTSQYTLDIKGKDTIRSVIDGGIYWYNLILTKGINVTEINKAYVEVDYTTNWKLLLNSDGSIPFYDAENDIQGWIDTAGEKVDFIKRKLCNFRCKK